MIPGHGLAEKQKADLGSTERAHRGYVLTVENLRPVQGFSGAAILAYAQFYFASGIGRAPRAGSCWNSSKHIPSGRGVTSAGSE